MNNNVIHLIKCSKVLYKENPTLHIHSILSIHTYNFAPLKMVTVPKMQWQICPYNVCTWGSCSSLPVLSSSHIYPSKPSCVTLSWKPSLGVKIVRVVPGPSADTTLHILCVLYSVQEVLYIFLWNREEIHR